MSDWAAQIADEARAKMPEPWCGFCGADDDISVASAYEYWLAEPGVNVCSACCTLIATTFVKKHGGPPIMERQTEPKRYQKQVIPRSLSKAVFERDLYRCVECQTHLDLTCDHIVAESKGGPTTLDNLRTLCRPCNSRKGANDLP